jgi:FMN reductase
LKITVIAGNPKPGSRTLEAASLLAERITGQSPDTLIDVVTLGPSLLGWGDQGVKDAVASAAASDLLIVASPTYKASYTGVLKVFLDQFAGQTGLAGVVTIPLMLGAGPAHALAPELLLKPVLVELGAVVPVQGLYLNEKAYTEESSTEAWLAQWRPLILSMLATKGSVNA